MEKILRASKAGFPCDKNIWYSINGYEGLTDSNTQRIFDVGTALEPVIVKWLELDGWTVKYNPGNQEALTELLIPLNGGKLAGHYDCIISRANEPEILIDIKTMNDYAYKVWKKAGTLKTRPQYADQVHIYAYGLMLQGMRIKELGILGMNKNNSSYYLERFKYDSERMKGILARSEYILSCESAPESGTRMESWCCRYCEYSRICDNPS